MARSVRGSALSTAMLILKSDGTSVFAVLSPLAEGFKVFGVLIFATVVLVAIVTRCRVGNESSRRDGTLGWW